jgi:hypothetical protein
MKNTKNTKNTKLFALVTILILTVALLTACSSLGGFTRGTAVNLIEQDKRYSAPATMTIDIGARLANARAKAWQISQDDTAEAATVRAKEDFMLRHPQIILAQHLGFIKLYFDNPELGPREIGDQPTELYRARLGVWNFKARAEITEEGRKLWRDLKLREDNESLPLAVRQTPEITGLTDEGQVMKRAEFTFKWRPTELGEAFDPGSAAFGKLPPDLQEALKKTQRNIFGGGGSNIMDFATPRKGIATFKKFDDGWRLSDLLFQ